MNDLFEVVLLIEVTEVGDDVFVVREAVGVLEFGWDEFTEAEDFCDEGATTSSELEGVLTAVFGCEVVTDGTAGFRHSSFFFF